MNSRHSKSSAPPDESSASGSGSNAQTTCAKNEERGSDVLLVHGVTSDGDGLNVLRQRNQQLEFGAIHPARPGRPIHGELVKLRPRRECPLVCDVDVQYAPADADSHPDDAARPQSGGRRGPARVASEAYRMNWDAIWSQPPKDDLVN